MPVNSQNPTISNSFLGNINNIGSNLPVNNVFPARVLDINLTPSVNSDSLFQRSRGWFGIGSITFEPIGDNSIIHKNPKGNIALPLDSNYRKTPLINEVVIIIAAPGEEGYYENDVNISNYYYISTINVWNSINANPYPSPSNFPKDNKKSYEEVSQGFPNQNNQDNSVKLGNIFKENDDIRNLYPQEGDVMVEGRFGNSIRFTSTNRQSEDFKDIQSPWSREGNNGSPLTIIRNGQQSTSGFDQFLPLYEDIDRDDSSIYMTTTQNIGITLASTNLNSFGIDITPQVKTTARIQRTPKGESGKSNNDSDNITLQFDSVNVEPKGSSNSVSPNDLDELSNLSSNPTEFEREEFETEEELTRSEEIEQQQRDRGGERDI
ncbi:hypothetical protein OAE25_00075 [Verrucomicrobiales bacterium]|nr:hypothetical protein [Verrucomicrobiales bacterium]|tara:strand:- start:1523 stop:2656 length:1134 start_codon:yes stop_codon:yes gene_type:complete